MRQGVVVRPGTEKRNDAHDIADHCVDDAGRLPSQIFRGMLGVLRLLLLVLLCKQWRLLVWVRRLLGRLLQSPGVIPKFILRLFLWLFGRQLRLFELQLRLL